MFRVDRKSNTLTKLKPSSFSDLGFKERTHLQEWLVDHPEALGEDLLIIQKEFNGFDDTNERLDLLALDKEGRLVVIENKLDDSGRDVCWQAIKYASYCSTLSKTEILEIYEAYLEKYDLAHIDAESEILAFLDVSDFESLVLNTGEQSVRLILVAANFRKEVTSTVLWLAGYNIDIQCHETKVQVYNNEVFLSFNKIIPAPATEDFMIKKAKKNSAEKTAKATARSKEKLYTQFWQLLLNEMKLHDTELFSGRTISSASTITSGFGATAGLSFAFSYRRKEGFSAELRIASKDKEYNDKVFSVLYNNKANIERMMGEPLRWQRQGERTAPRIQTVTAGDISDQESWPIVANELAQGMVRLEGAMKALILKAAA